MYQKKKGQNVMNFILISKNEVIELFRAKNKNEAEIYVEENYDDSEPLELFELKHVISWK